MHAQSCTWTRIGHGDLKQHTGERLGVAASQLLRRCVQTVGQTCTPCTVADIIAYVPRQQCQRCEHTLGACMQTFWRSTYPIDTHSDTYLQLPPPAGQRYIGVLWIPVAHVHNAYRNSIRISISISIHEPITSIVTMTVCAATATSAEDKHHQPPSPPGTIRYSIDSSNINLSCFLQAQSWFVRQGIPLIIFNVLLSCFYQ